MRFLVAYGSKRGGTAELAFQVGASLRSAGHDVEVKAASAAGDVEAYDAVVVGGALYMLRWHRDARRFVRRHAEALSRRPVWLFSSGPLDESANRKEIAPVPQVARLMRRVGAQGHATFGGRLTPDARGFPASAMAKKHAGDWRDPARVRAWAEAIAARAPSVPRLPAPVPPPVPWSPFLTVASAILAALVAIASLAGIFVRSIYGRETASWTAQGVGQDWVNLAVVVPWLAASALLARRGSQRGALLAGGALTYTLYSYVIYAFSVHFNALFLVYCAILGLSAFALAKLVAGELRRDPRPWFDDGAPARLAGGLQVVTAALFALLWLSEVIPALLSGDPPASLDDVGLVTNPVHILDLAFMLPLMILAGLSLARRRSFGYVLGPMTLAFGVLMMLAIEGMFLAMAVRGVAVSAPAAVLGVVVLVLSAGVLARLVAHVRPRAPA